MRYGAQNQIRARVTSVKKGDVVALIEFSVTPPADMASVTTRNRRRHSPSTWATRCGLVVKAIPRLGIPRLA